MKKVLFLLLFSSILVNAQNVTITPGGITPALTGTYPRISYDEILALPSPVVGDQAFDITFLCMRVYNGTRWECSYQLPNEDVADLALIVSDGGASSDGSNSVAIDALGNVYVAGFFEGTATFGAISKTSAGEKDIFIAKYNSSGSLQWVQFAGGTASDIANSIAVDGSGNVYITGFYQSTAIFGLASLTSVGSSDIFIAKYNSSGSLQWVQTGGSTSTDNANSLAIDPSGNVYVTGYYRGTATFGTASQTSAGAADIFVVKYSSNGSLQWLQSAGGTSSDVSNSIAVDASGNVYVTGIYRDTATFGATNKTSDGSSDIFIAKYNSSGSLQWVQSEGGNSSDFSSSIAIDISGNVYLTGYFDAAATFGSISKTSFGGVDIFIAKYNSSGSLQWVESAGGTNSDVANSLAIDVSGNAYLTGYFNLTATFGNTSITSFGSGDIFIAKYNSSGSFQWVQSEGSATSGSATSIAAGDSGNVYISGYYEGMISFGVTSKTSTGSDDVFIVRVSQ